MKNNKVLLRSLFVSLVISSIFIFPYIMKDFLPIEHDTFFHLSRIEGLTNALKNKEFLPALYPEKNNGFGYASPLFYSDIWLLPYAILHYFSVPLTTCYVIMVYIDTFLAALAMMYLIQRILHKESVSYLIAIAYTFCNYHITDVYVRGAVGEVQAMIFLPVLLTGLYVILYEHTESHTLLTIGLTGLILSHNLTFLMGVILCILFFCICIKHVTKQVFITLCKAVLYAFGITLFFSIPMLEQLQDNDYYLNYYAASSNLAQSSLPLWKYFANTTVFGYSNHDLERDRQMLLNVGYFLQFVPLLYIFTKKEHRQPFVFICLILGYIFLLLPSIYIPWDYLSFMRVMQFPWRFLQLSMVLLCIPAAYVIQEFLQSNWKIAGLCLLLVSEGIWHIQPVLTRTFGMTSQMTWNDITNGVLVNPYYSATYMRVELAGGDYLPLDSLDYREIPNTIMNAEHESLPITFTTEYNKMTFYISEDYVNEMIILPKTYYKGYHIYLSTNNELIECTNIHVLQGLLSFIPEESGTYICVYEDTNIRKICTGISWITLLLFCFEYVYQKKRTA